MSKEICELMVAFLRVLTSLLLVGNDLVALKTRSILVMIDPSLDTETGMNDVAQYVVHSRNKGQLGVSLVTPLLPLEVTMKVRIINHCRSRSFI